MTDLNIPLEAIQLAEAAVLVLDVVDEPDVCDVATDAITAAAPLIAAAAMEKLAAKYPDTEFPETANEIARCAAVGITLDGIQALAIRERALAEAKRLRGEQS